MPLCFALSLGGGSDSGNPENQSNNADEIQNINVNDFCRDALSIELSSKTSGAYMYRLQLEKDSFLQVQRLQQQLQEEIKLHAILESAIEKNAVKASDASHLPGHVQELVSNIALLESTILKLEQEFISLHFQVSQERNERRLAEYHWRQSTPSLFVCSDIVKAPILSSLSCSMHSMSEPGHSSEDISCQKLKDQPSEANSKSSSTYLTTEQSVTEMDTNFFQPVDGVKLTREVDAKDLWDNPNQLSEEMVRCMKNIFISLADSTTPLKSSTSETQCSYLSPCGHLSNSYIWSSSERSILSSWVQSPQLDLQGNLEMLATGNACDPYRVRGKLSWADIGRYGLATEVSWMSVGRKQLEYAAGALRRFRTLVAQLAKVNPIHLSCDEKLAFWINLYNALIMHAYLAYGVPRSDLKLFSLMQKAAYIVGGHSFSATAIEYVILKMKPPAHRPQIALLLALHKLKGLEEQRKSSIDSFQPLVAFALSSGMYSSPAIRIYTASNVREELQEAQHDFIRASVGVSSKGRLLIPKMLHCFAKGFIDDANLAVWISHYLPPHQAAIVEQCISKRRQSLLSSRNCGILPFDSRFRYLFLPEQL
ncbi:uncharacterized protein LOC130788324 isoform X3 [Actinidia eriantha]|uniref:uncharacterized protein LOC130788324 isoform X3 n=1 Tax=Actinidia eriantha TaxID=165200 RepID=UPI002587F669|nr:uncharacterized protein LOC130788324 isoform X3 [Actinidia eriantha]